MRLSARTMILGAIGLAVAGLPIVTTTQVAQAADTGGGTTFRASVTTAGQQADRESTRARISADGKFVVYQAKSRLDPVDKDGFQDVYWTDLRDPFHPVTRRVSTPEGGGTPDGDSEFSEISGDGRFVAFSTEAGNLDGPAGIYVRDMFPPTRRMHSSAWRVASVLSSPTMVATSPTTPCPSVRAKSWSMTASRVVGCS